MIQSVYQVYFQVQEIAEVASRQAEAVFLVEEEVLEEEDRVDLGNFLKYEIKSRQ
jgi:hypothetical protein